MDQNTNRTTLKIFGVIMLLFGIVYGIVGSLALAGTLQGVLPGHQTQEILVIVLAYGVALLGLAGVIYNQIALDSFILFDMLGLLFGVSIAATAMKLKK